MNFFKDDNGLVYAHPERSCKTCLNYPCLENMDTLRSDFGRYGCKNYSDANVFTIKKK
jgi:hypothetical protein